MSKKPLRKKCKYGCGLIPVDLFADHTYLHEAQTELVPLEQYTNPPEPKRRRARVHNGGAA